MEKITRAHLAGFQYFRLIAEEGWPQAALMEIIDDAIAKAQAAPEAEPVAIVEYTGYEPANSLRWLSKGLAYMEPGTKLYANAPAQTGSTEPVQLDVVGYASPGQIEVLREVPRTGGMKVRGVADHRYTEPLVTLANARSALFQVAIRCEQAGAFKACLECGYQDGHDEICKFHESRRTPAQPDASGLVDALEAWKSAEDYAKTYGHLPEADTASAWHEATVQRDAALAAYRAQQGKENGNG